MWAGVSSQTAWMLLPLFLAVFPEVYLCQESSNTASYKSPTFSPTVGELAYSSEPVHTDAIDEFAIWKMVQEQETELRRAHFKLSRIDLPTTSNKAEREETTEFETPAVLITPRMNQVSTSSEEDNYNVKQIVDIKDPSEVNAKAAALRGFDDLLDPGYGRERCQVMPQIKTCSEVRDTGKFLWYYDQIEKRCLSTSDCILNDNRFESEADCKSNCLPKSPLKRCLAPPKAGYAQCVYSDNRSGPSTTIQKAYFDKALERCSWFVYLGCGESDNQFGSIEECNDTCMTPEALTTIRQSAQEVCELPRLLPDGTGCEDVGQTTSRWYYDAQTQLCKEFGYSHCSGTANNFLSKSSCELFCGAKTLSQEAICELPPETGDCRIQKPHEMWYYDSGNGGCLSFAYSGCGGNENRFPSLSACLEACGSQNSALTMKSGASQLEEEEASLKENKAKGESLEADPPRERLPLFQSPIYNLTTFSPQPVEIEPCSKRPDPGQCIPIGCQNGTDCQIKRLMRWFFNPRTSNCENFAYSGCGGSANTFDSAQSCSIACKQRIMRPGRDRRCDSNPKRDGCYNLPLPHHNETVIEAPEVLFYFSVSSGTCRAFHLKADGEGCGRQAYFTDGQECLKACSKSSPTEQDLPNRCFARKLNSGASKCPLERHNISRWSYLSDLQQCVLFSECHNPDAPASSAWGNNFESKELCEATCMPKGLKDVCRLPRDTGPCSGSHARYYYDPVEGKCRLFMYGGCLGNGNRFNTKIECEEACGTLSEIYDTGASVTKTTDVSTTQAERVPPVPAEVFEEMRRIKIMYSERYPWDFCLQHHTYGTCPRPRRLHDGSSDHGVHLTRYFYNRKTKHCEPYFYTGCGARGNHFETKSQCDNVCTRRLRRSVSPICDASHVEECSGSGLRLWIYEAEAGTCRQMEVCPATRPAPVSFQLPLGVTNEVFRLQPGISDGSGINSYLLPGTFASSSACYNYCLPPTPSGTDVTNICHIDPITSVSNECRMMGKRWYFDVKDGYCRSYISCPVYGNNFADEETCNSACRPKHISEVCRLPLDYGGCSSFLPRWYYNTDKRRCEQFSYGGCFGNSNRFLTKLECDNACTHNDVCGLPKPKEAEGNEPSTLRYFFNQTTGECEKFFFSGKIPQGNNFANEATCHSVCISSPNLLPISVKINKMAISMARLATKFGQVALHPVLSRGHKSTCLSSTQLLSILKNETIQNCHPGGTVTELAYAYDAASVTCFPTMIYVCLDYPNEPYRMKILGRSLIFESQAHCESECLRSER
ncbi:Papilin [Taenia crassiceps]|uniref:Papilin n=1 Tax=Taenia crassiceps TaxID=6207 RepID=A0ABR4QGK1_9CEST